MGTSVFRVLQVTEKVTTSELVAPIHHRTYTDAPRPFQGRKIELSAGFSAAFRYGYFHAISGHLSAFFAGKCPQIVTKWLGDTWSVAMATIVARKRADGPRFTTQIRLERNGELAASEPTD